MRPFHVVRLALLVFVSILAAQGETVTLSNGDRLTGSVGDSDGKALTLKTDYAGEIKIQWSAIKELTSQKPLYVTTSDKKTISGSILPNGANLTVRTATETSVEVPLASVSTIRTFEGQEAYEKSLHPGWKEDWKGSFTLGAAIARGNSDTTDLNTAFGLNRKTLSDEVIVYESSIYSTSGLPGQGVTANAVLGGARYDRNISDRLFVFVSADFTHDELQNLTLRSIISGGLGWHAIATPNTTFNVLGGINYTHESYSGSAATSTPGVGRNLPGITAGEELTHKFSPMLSFIENAYFYPDLSDISQYRFSVDASSVAKINKWFGWEISFSDRYVTNPPIPGTKSNDIILSTGLNIAFGK
jgi:putative salt-induced outer membrane protein